MVEQFQSKYEEKIKEIIRNYANQRIDNQLNFTGQFVDRIGIQKSQYGIYGMSVFSFLSININEIKVRKLREDNLKKLKEWINGTIGYQIKEEDANDFKNRDPHSYIYELKNVTSKIIYAYHCLAVADRDSDELRILKKIIYDSQNSNHGFSFLANSQSRNSSNIFSTSQVLRAFYKEDSLANRNAISYLLGEINTNPKNSEIFKTLYALNSIQIFLYEHRKYLNEDKYKKIKPKIIKVLQTLFQHVNVNPTSFANPINVDFNDYGRTRYFRLYSDLILLESLILVYPNKLYPIFGKLGKSLILNITEALNSEIPYLKDTTSHRLSFGYLDQLSNINDLLYFSKNENILSWYSILYGKFWRMYYFGIDIMEEFLLTFIPILAGIIIFVTGQEVLKIPWLAYMLARLGSLVSLWFKNSKQNKL